MKRQAEIAEWSETKCKLVDASVALMRSRGFNSTSLDDICKTAGVTKGGFFHYFKSKQKIATAALKRFAAGKARDFQDAPFRKLAAPLERVFGRLDFIEESFKAGGVTKGCLVGVMAQEMSFANPELRSICRESFSWMASDFEMDLADAKAAHNPAAAFDPTSLSMYYVAILQGSMLIAKAEENNTVMLQNIEHFRRHLEFLFGMSAQSKGEPAKSPLIGNI